MAGGDQTNTFWEISIFHKYNYFSSFEAGNFVSNSSIKQDYISPGAPATN